MGIANLLDRIWLKEAPSKEFSKVDVSDFPYKLETNFSNWLRSQFSLSYLDPERVNKRLADAAKDSGAEFKFTNDAKRYALRGENSKLLGLETISYELNRQGRAAVGDTPINIHSASDSKNPAQSQVKSRLRNQLAAMGYKAEDLGKAQVALAELRKYGYLAPKISQTSELGVFADEEKTDFRVLGEVTKVTYVIDLADEKLARAISRINSVEYVGEEVVEKELVEA